MSPASRRQIGAAHESEDSGRSERQEMGRNSLVAERTMAATAVLWRQGVLLRPRPQDGGRAVGRSGF